MASTGVAGDLITAREAGLVACVRCGRVHELDATHCSRCGAVLESRDFESPQKVWAWLMAGMVSYVPANVYPMLRTNTITEKSESTIIGGAIDLMHHGAIGIAAIVFFASVVIPVGKFMAIAYLAISVQRKSILQQHQRHKLYEVVEFVGRWSMIDVFVVAILSALVQLDGLASINPGIAAFSFALSVIFTMLSAQSFDARLIWDIDRTKHAK